MNNGMLINKSHTRQFILDAAKRVRPGWQVSRVSQEAFEILNARFRNMVIRMLESHPTRGKTFMGE